MKETTGEGSMTIVTIVIIVAMVAAAIAVVTAIISNTEKRTDEIGHYCTTGYTWNESQGKCVKNS